MEISLQKSSRFKPNQWNPLARHQKINGETMWGIMVPRKYPHQQKYPWIKDNSKTPCSPRSAIHLPSYLGKTRWREWVSFIGIFYQLLGQFDLKKTSCSGERAIPNSVLFPILFHYIMAYMHAKSQVFI